jgi:putative tryptophan/tyrosine transport system substrate-binding protein
MTSRRARRTLLGAIGAGLVAPRLVFAQATKKVSVVVLFAGEEEDDEPATRVFFDEMRRLGWAEGVNIAYERLHGRGTREYMEGLAKSAASSNPDLIYATATSIALTVVKESDSVPVVFTAASDPVAAGLVASLARPGGNATGAYQAPGDAVQKRLELVRQAFPHLKRIGVLLDRRSVDYARQKSAHQDAARLTGLELAVVEFTNYEAVAKHLANFRRDGIVGVELTPSVTLLARRREVAEAALRNRIALIGHRVEWAEAGAVLSYGADVADALRRSAAIADRILKGARPANTPVQLATKFEMVVNQRSAKALGLAIPPEVLRRADRVIE